MPGAARPAVGAHRNEQERLCSQLSHYVALLGVVDLIEQRRSVDQHVLGMIPKRDRGPPIRLFSQLVSGTAPLTLAVFFARSRIDTRAVPVSPQSIREEDTVDRHRAGSRELSLEEVEDALDLRSVIATSLATTPVDDQALRRGVWTYVCAERDLGTRPGSVIITLTEMVESSTIAPRSVRDDVMRRVILWCVEAYFGHLGGEGVGLCATADTGEVPRAPQMIVSNR
jgi:hypothetical protein